MNLPTADASAASSGKDAIRLRLEYRPPYAWQALIGFLGGRTIDGVEEIEAETYRRTLRVEAADATHAGWLTVAHDATTRALEVRVAPSLAVCLPTLQARVEHVFDLRAEPDTIAAALGALAAPAPGLRVPGAFDGFELAVRAVLGQQITVKAARTLAARFAAAFGSPLDTPWPGLQRVFPTPAHIAGQSQDAIASLGIIGARARTIIGLAEALAGGRLNLAPGEDHAGTVQALKALPGIGEWTAQYIAMRALAARDAFPHTDYGVMKALGERNPRLVLAQAEAWRPWRAYAVMHLWRSLA
jgi:AraC family transcriptional regulator of adaptative response / DNA-3-methyladenine glycosylase II